MEKVSCLNLPNCYRLSNGEVEVVVTTDVGPRVIRYAFRGAENVLGEVPEASVRTGLGEWKPWGGHRLWAAPEATPRSYVPDNDPVEFEPVGEAGVRLRQKIEAPTGLQKELTVSLDATGTRVRLDHRITNRNLWGLRLAPWALTIMRGGGVTIVPQEPYRTWDECLAPARPLVLWHYTDLSDPRWRLGARFIRLRADAALDAPQKIGVLNRQGWAAYHRGSTLFVKTVPYRAGAEYPDFGSNFETYTAGSFMEVETLAPLQNLEPGESATHVEEWSLFGGVAPPGSEEEVEAEVGERVRRALSRTPSGAGAG